MKPCGFALAKYLKLQLTQNFRYNINVQTLHNKAPDFNDLNTVSRSIRNRDGLLIVRV